jgi:hypothetical protein
MPITLGCPSCGKRFRARDESAGKRVKCPYCAAAVPVPTAEEAAAAGAPTAALPPPPPAAPPGRAAPAPVASAESWGAGAPAAPAKNPFAGEATSPPPPAAIPKRADTAKPAAKAPAKPAIKKTPEELAAAGWKKARSGLCWVLLGLFWLSIPGFVGFGKLVYTRQAGDLPAGEGWDWFKIPGYVNDGQNTILKTKPDQLNFALYALPVVLGGLCLTFGRLTAGAAPRNSGAGGLFAFSGLFTLLGLAGLLTAAACSTQYGWGFTDEYLYGGFGFILLGGLAEFLFLTGVTASGLALKRPSVARAVGLIGFLFALTAFIPTLGWTLYTEPKWKLRPTPPDDQWLLYEQAALMLGWLLIIGVYWRAVRGVRLAIKEHLQSGTA